jgi:hypothetical protein
LDKAHFLGYGGERTLLEKEQWSPLSTALVGREGGRAGFSVYAFLLLLLFCKELY